MKIDTLTLSLENDSAIYKQLFEYIKNSINLGHFSPGDILPSSRNLAADMSISRTSVLNAYNALLAEGLIVGQQGAGYRISGYNQETSSADSKGAGGVNDDKQRYLPFNPVPIDTSFFPAHKWAKIIAKIARTMPLSLVNTNDYDWQGNRELREVLCQYLYEKKGISCTSAQIMITSGSMESLEICINAITAPGQMVSIEDPYYPGLRNYLLNNNRLVDYMQVDEQGACCDEIANNSRVAIITSGNQFPLGIAMSKERKKAFSAWAVNSNTWVIEDDYDSDFNPKQEPTLAALDKNRRTLYLGNFSKLITSDLRIGFVVIPELLLPHIQQMEYALKTSYLPQLVLKEFVRTGDFYRNLLKAKKIYAGKRDFFITLLQRELTASGQVFLNPVGSLVVFELSPELVDVEIVELAKVQGLSLRALSPLCHYSRRNGLVMGYIYFNREVLRKAVRQLKNVITLYRERQKSKISL
ncbi:PLP-dependent aminotransferase family protein [Klebsiella huaxiensis]|uniref:MocR-like pyridoxine biosynthesis transcription factor PdxR n=1 Tax=Klebsiella huaxiensis TaxID=2153354 RepID=UPI003169DBED